MTSIAQSINLIFANLLGIVDFESFQGDVEARRIALTAARALVRRLETPMDTLWDMGVANAALLPACRVALHLNVFEALSACGEKPKTTEELAGNEADPALLRRILRHLASMNIIDDCGPNLWGPTRHSDDLRRPEIYALVDHAHDTTVRSLNHLPNYLKERGYKNPGSDSKTNWQIMKKTDQIYFQWMISEPHIQKTHINFMTGYTSQRGTWFDVYPTSEIVRSADHEGPIIVDVAGGRGQDLIKFLTKYPKSKGRLILQDQPQVIDSWIKTDGIEPMPHDIFEMQRVHGARAYFTHSVCHDWPDDKALAILKNIRPAMKPGYSSLFLNEVVIPETGVNRHQSSVDMMMMALYNSRERTKEDWAALLEQAGFRVKSVWYSEAAYEGVVEAEAAEDTDGQTIGLQTNGSVTHGVH